jgi:hypothetical protein
MSVEAVANYFMSRTILIALSSLMSPTSPTIRITLINHSLALVRCQMQKMVGE